MECQICIVRPNGGHSAQPIEQARARPVRLHFKTTPATARFRSGRGRHSHLFAVQRAAHMDCTHTNLLLAPRCTTSPERPTSTPTRPIPTAVRPTVLACGAESVRGLCGVPARRSASVISRALCDRSARLCFATYCLAHQIVMFHKPSATHIGQTSSGHAPPNGDEAGSSTSSALA